MYADLIVMISVDGDNMLVQDFIYSVRSEWSEQSKFLFVRDMTVQPPRSWTKLFYAIDIIEISDQETVHRRAIAYRVHMLWSVSSAPLGILPYFSRYLLTMWSGTLVIYAMAGWGKVERTQNTKYRDFVQSLGTQIQVYLLGCIVHVGSI